MKHRRYVTLLLFFLWVILFPFSVQAQNQYTPAAAAYKHSANLTPTNYHPEKGGRSTVGSRSGPGSGTGRTAQKNHGCVRPFRRHQPAEPLTLIMRIPCCTKTCTILFPNIRTFTCRKREPNGTIRPTVQWIPNRYTEVFPKGSDTIAYYLKKLGSGVVLGLEQWQWFGLRHHSARLRWRCMFVTYFASEKVARALTKRRIIHSAEIVPGPSARLRVCSVSCWPCGLFERCIRCCCCALSFNATIPHGRRAWMQIVFLGFLFYKMADVFALIGAKIAANTASTLDDQLVPHVKKLGKALYFRSPRCCWCFGPGGH